MKKSAYSLGHALAATCLVVFSAIPIADALVQTAAPAGLQVPAKTIEVPTTVSPQLQKIIGAPLRSNWDIQPKTGEEWKPVAEAGAIPTIKNVPGMLERLKVKVEKTAIDGVRAYIVTPETIAPQNRNRQLIHMHGGCYVLNPGEAGLPEAIFMAGFGHIKVISVDYRMPPEAVFPGALDDGITVWKAALKTTDPKNMAIFGTSAGGALTLEMVLKAKELGLPFPGAIAPGTPMSDVTKVGDTFYQRDAGQRSGLARRLLRRRRQGVCQRARPEGSDVVARLRRHERLSPDHPDQRHARPVADQHRSRSPQASAGRRRGHAASL
jgi:epsilon-lactone hydrolase